MDCPFCHGKNTLSVDTASNNINWFCFHAACKAKGKYHRGKRYDLRKFYVQSERRNEEI
jgi:hypothetical protein